ncbi:MAG: YicC/YloC family endoribonuclease [Treponemataceae bacterium]
MNSMTGCAFEEVANESETICVEIKSYNSRYLDINIALPNFLSRYENLFREKIQQSVTRGKIDVYIKIQEKCSNISISVDFDVAKKYEQAVKMLANKLEIEDNEAVLPFLLRQNEVFVKNIERDCESYCNQVLAILDKALLKLTIERSREGKNLLCDITKMLAKLDECIDFFEGFQPKLESVFYDQTAKKMQELLGENADNQRLMQEVAFMVVKHTINEEIVRLRSHSNALHQELQGNLCSGRKIDFICQEINREINTIGSKNQCVELAPYVITAKDALENIREQSRNIE